MNNTEKLLRALIDALGFDVEEAESLELSHTIPFLCQSERDIIDIALASDHVVSRVQADTVNNWEFYRKTTDYKLTKRASDD